MGEIFKRFLRDLLNGRRKFMQCCVFAFTAIWVYCLWESFEFIFSVEFMGLVRTNPASAAVGMGIPTAMNTVMGGIWLKMLRMYSDNGVRLDAQRDGLPREFHIEGTMRTAGGEGEEDVDTA